MKQTNPATSTQQQVKRNTVTVTQQQHPLKVQKSIVLPLNGRKNYKKLLATNTRHFPCANPMKGTNMFRGQQGGAWSLGHLVL